MGALAVLAALLTGACVPDDEPPRTAKERVELSASDREGERADGTASSERTAEPEADVPPGAPIRPKAMSRTDEAGAAAAATYFVELERYAFRTGDLTEWVRISDHGCKWCWVTAANVAAIFGVGDSTVGGETSWPAPVLFTAEPEKHVYGYTFELTSEPMSRVDPAGAVVASGDAQHVLFDVLVGHTPDGWRMLLGQVRASETAEPAVPATP